MKTSKTANRNDSGRHGKLAAGLLGVSAAAALGLGLAAVTSGEARAQETDADLTLEEIVEIVNAMDLGQVYEVERERKRYEVKLRAPDGVWVKLYLNASTGEVLHQERGDEDEGDHDEDDD